MTQNERKILQRLMVACELAPQLYSSDTFALGVDS